MWWGVDGVKQWRFRVSELSLWKDSRTVFYHLYICLTEVTRKKKSEAKIACSQLTCFSHGAFSSCFSQGAWISSAVQQPEQELPRRVTSTESAARCSHNPWALLHFREWEEKVQLIWLVKDDSSQLCNRDAFPSIRLCKLLRVRWEGADCKSLCICMKMEFKTFPLEWYPIPKLDLGTQSTWIFVLSIRVICIQNPFLVCFLYHASFLIHFQSLMYCCVASSPIRPCNVLRLPSAWLHLIASVNRT